MTTKEREREDLQREAGKVLKGCKNHAEFRAVLHEYFGLSVDESRALDRTLYKSPPAAPASDTESRAGVARAFRDAREKREARSRFLHGIVSDAAKAEARRTPGGFTWYTPGGTGRQALKARPEELFDPVILDPIQDRLAGELAAELEECKDRETLEAKLVRLDWPDGAIAEYLEMA